MKPYLLALALLAGCAKKALETRETNNPNFKVERLFETDGCRVYRFTDEGNSHYFATCGDQTTTESEIPEGKTWRHEQITVAELP